MVDVSILRLLFADPENIVSVEITGVRKNIKQVLAFSLQTWASRQTIRDSKNEKSENGEREFHVNNQWFCLQARILPDRSVGARRSAPRGGMTWSIVQMESESAVSG